MFNFRVSTHWKLQALADWLWDCRLVAAGNVVCRLAALIYPIECKRDPAQWNGYF